MKFGLGLSSSWLLAAMLAGGALLSSTNAQGGGFTAYDIYYAGPQPGTVGLPDGLVRIDPLTGDSALLKMYIANVTGLESLSFDTYRQRLILVARLSSSDPLYTTYFVDAAGDFAPSRPRLPAGRASRPPATGASTSATPSPKPIPSSGSTRPTRCTCSTPPTASRPS